MESYKHIFDNGIADANKINEVDNVTRIYPNFRNIPQLFHFIMAVGPIKYFSDTEAMNLSLNTNATLTDFFVRVGPSKAGGGLPTLDVVESRHILMLTWMFTQLNKVESSLSWSDKHVVEIGGGYGNFARLANKVITPARWSIIDLEYISNLQKWFLREENIDSTNIAFTTTEKYTTITDSFLTIGTHSLSEFDLDTFKLYFDTNIKYSKYFFYVCHNEKPSVSLINEKFNIINSKFKVINEQKYEGNNCTMYLYKNIE